MWTGIADEGDESSREGLRTRDAEMGAVAVGEAPAEHARALASTAEARLEVDDGYPGKSGGGLVLGSNRTAPYRSTTTS
jgi:hypothetical protein